MNGDMQELMTFISEGHAAQMTAIAALGKEFAEHKGATNERLTDLERTDTRQWIVSACVVPFITLAHFILNKLGIKV